MKYKDAFSVMEYIPLISGMMIESWLVMNSKRTIVNILVVVAAFVIFILWYECCIKNRDVSVSTNNPTVTPMVNSPYVIYLITGEEKYQFWKDIHQGVSDMADLLQLSFTWVAPEVADADQQIELLNRAVDNGADAILISVIDSDKLAEPIKAAKEKGVKIIYVNRAANEDGIVTLSTNNYEAGKTAARTLLEELDDAGIQKGVIGIVSVSKDNQSVNQRDNGFIDVFKEDGRFTVLDPVYTGGSSKSAETAATELIQNQSNLVALFGSNEGTSIGVGNAIKEDGNRIIGIAFDKSDAIMELYRKGSFKAVIEQHPYTMGYLGLAEAYAALKGYNTGPSYINTGVTVIAREKD